MSRKANISLFAPRAGCRHSTVVIKLRKASINLNISGCPLSGRGIWIAAREVAGADSGFITYYQAIGLYP